MAANIHGKMVYSFEKPMWHNIVEPSVDPLFSEEILDTRFGGGFPIETRPITVFLNGQNVETGDFAIVRCASPYEDTERVFGYCTERYHVLQPREVCQSFDANVNQHAETMAFLGHGEDMFISWKMPSLKVGDKEEVETYGIVRTGFDTLKGTRLFTSIFRPVCSNTITLAEGWAKNNGGYVWKGKAVNHNLLRDLGYWLSHVQTKAIRETNLLQGLFGKFASTPIVHDSQAKDILNQAYPNMGDVAQFFPVQLQDEKREKTEDYNDKQKAIRDGIFDLFAGAGTAITPDFWGMMNATSEYFCHVQPSKKPIYESVMFGARQANTMKMIKVLDALS